MAKGKKNKKNNAFYKAIKPLVKNKRVLFSLLGAAGLGVALTAAFRSEKGHVIVDKIAEKARDFTQDIRRNKSNSPVNRPAGA